MTLPYSWHPDGVVTHYGTTGRHPRAAWRRLQPGDLVPWEHRVYVVTELRVIPVDQWTDIERTWVEQEARHQERYRTAATLYPHPTVVSTQPYPVPADPVAAKHEFERSGLEWRLLDRRQPARYPDEHYPVCGSCGEPTPCREVMARRVSEAAAERMGRFEAEWFCPACKGPVSARQGRETFAWNLEIPGGPPVTFHTKKPCVLQLAEYRKRLTKAGYFVALGIEGVVPS